MVVISQTLTIILSSALLAVFLFFGISIIKDKNG